MTFVLSFGVGGLGISGLRMYACDLKVQKFAFGGFGGQGVGFLELRVRASGGRGIQAESGSLGCMGFYPEPQTLQVDGLVGQGLGLTGFDSWIRV